MLSHYAAKCHAINQSFGFVICAAPHFVVSCFDKEANLHIREQKKSSGAFIAHAFPTFMVIRYSL